MLGNIIWFVAGMVVMVIVGFFVIKNNKAKFLTLLDKAIEEVVSSGIETRTSQAIDGVVKKIKARL
jgi:hypothetical protein